MTFVYFSRPIPARLGPKPGDFSPCELAAPDRRLAQLRRHARASSSWTPERRAEMHDLASRRGITDVAEAKYHRTFAFGVWG